MNPIAIAVKAVCSNVYISSRSARPPVFIDNAVAKHVLNVGR